jgi:hypothetical protein
MIFRGGDKLTQTMKDLQGKVAGLPTRAKVCIKSVRYGALQQIMIHPNGGREAGTYRGGWFEITNDPKLTSNHYMVGCQPLLMIQ